MFKFATILAPGHDYSTILVIILPVHTSSAQSTSVLNPNQIGVVGAGTMGSGIALTALFADLHVRLYDINPAILAKASEYIETHLNRKKRAINIKYLTLTQNLEDLASSGIVIEAAPEVLSIKQELFGRLAMICPPPTILATNTSTLPVTAIATAAEHPERVGGMHFFNPAPVLPLVEVIQGAQTSAETLQALVGLAQKMGKTPVVAQDRPGFIVNRVARPFYGEALRLVGEGVAPPEQIDRIVRQGGGFRMGPFELMDLIGIDVNFAATQSMYEQSFGEPRYRPHPIQARMVQQKALGRKTGRGFYNYENGAHQPAEPPVRNAPVKADFKARSVHLVAGNWGPGIANLCRQADYLIENGNPHREMEVAAGIITSGKVDNLVSAAIQLDHTLPGGIPLLVQSAGVTVTEIATWLEHSDRLVGFDGLFLNNGPVATLVPSPVLTSQARKTTEEFFRSLGREPVWINDSPGLVLPRIVCMLANEAAFATGEGVADMDTIDTAMRLGTNYPKGPLAWAKELGYQCVVDVLDHLQQEYREERYRVAPLLRRWARLVQVNS
jgi:3-hydroxybutyryl-CoA dehydrogenase